MDVSQRGGTITIEAASRWDAVDLARRLPACRWYLVERDRRHWELYVAPERGGARRLESRVLDAAERWAAERHIEAVAHLPSGDVAIGGGNPAEAE